MEERNLEVNLVSDIELVFQIEINRIQIPESREINSFGQSVVENIVESAKIVKIELVITSTKYNVNFFKPIIFSVQVNSFLNKCIKFPIKISELTLDSALVVNVYDSFFPSHPKLMGGTSLRLFKNYRLLTGRKYLEITQFERGDAYLTPGDQHVMNQTSSISTKKISWLDKRLLEISTRLSDEEIVNDFKKNDLMMVWIKLPQSDLPVLYYSPPLQPLSSRHHHQSSRLMSTIDSNYSSTQESNIRIIYSSYNRKTSKFSDDVNFERENPVKQKILKLGQQPRTATPDIKEQSHLRTLLSRTIIDELTGDEKDMIWGYRYWLKKVHRDSLVSIIHSAFLNEQDLRQFDILDHNNTEEEEEEEGEGERYIQKNKRINEIHILKNKQKELEDVLFKEWNCDGLKLTDALELLCFRYEFYPFIRRFAVHEILERKSDSEIFGVLFQLVQALQYERSDQISTKKESSSFSKTNYLHLTPLGEFLLKKCRSCFEICVHMHYILLVEIDTFSSDKEERSKFENFHDRFLSTVFFEKPELKQQFDKMVCFVDYLQKYLETLGARELGRDIMKKEFRRDFSLKNLPLDIRNLFPFPFPLDPNIIITGIESEKCFFFKSKQKPLCMFLKTKDHGIIKTIYKKGDDLRQDMVITQTIRSMHHILLNNSLDLKLVPYRILSCELEAGFIEFVEGVESFHNIGSQDILNYLYTIQKIPIGGEKRMKRIQNNFSRSLAGYCVISYILGFGDRHLSNILIIEKGKKENIGKMFHIDFGYILGVPGIGKRFISPPIKLTKEMAQAVSGNVESKEFSVFLDYAKEAYLILRKPSNARLFVNLFLLLLDSKMEQIVLPTERFGSNKFFRILTIVDRMKRELDKTEAEKFIAQEIITNIASIGGRVEDGIHTIGQMFKK